MKILSFLRKEHIYFPSLRAQHYLHKEHRDVTRLLVDLWPEPTLTIPRTFQRPQSPACSDTNEEPSIKGPFWPGGPSHQQDRGGKISQETGDCFCRKGGARSLVSMWKERMIKLKPPRPVLNLLYSTSWPWTHNLSASWVLGTGAPVLRHRWADLPSVKEKTDIRLQGVRV